MKSWGFIETIGFVPLIAAIDSMTKAANIEIAGVEVIAGAMVTAGIKGDVADVAMAVDAGAAAAKKAGKLVCAHMIARPNDGAEKVLRMALKD